MDEQRWKQRATSFGAAADVYDRSRPGYPVEAVRYVLPTGASRVLDLGAGTGKLTQVLLDLGLDVAAVEPASQMRALLPARAEVLEGTAEAVPLPDGSVDAVLVGQAFHWFDTALALAEIARVLRPGGTLGLLWNVREDSAEWVRSVWDLLETAPGEEVVGTPFSGFAGLSDPEHQVFANNQTLDLDLLVDLVASRSAVIVLPESERTVLLEQVRTRAPEDEPFDLPYRTDVWRSVRI